MEANCKWDDKKRGEEKKEEKQCRAFHTNRYMGWVGLDFIIPNTAQLVILLKWLGLAEQQTQGNEEYRGRLRLARLCDCGRQAQAEVVSNSRNKIHQSL